MTLASRLSVQVTTKWMLGTGRRCMERELGVRSRTTMGWVEDKELIIKIKKIHACYVMKVDLTAIK